MGRSPLPVECGLDLERSSRKLLGDAQPPPVSTTFPMANSQYQGVGLRSHTTIRRGDETRPNPTVHGSPRSCCKRIGRRSSTGAAGRRTGPRLGLSIRASGSCLGPRCHQISTERSRGRWVQPSEQAILRREEGNVPQQLPRASPLGPAEKPAHAAQSGLRAASPTGYGFRPSPSEQDREQAFRMTAPHRPPRSCRMSSSSCPLVTAGTERSWNPGRV